MVAKEKTPEGLNVYNDRYVQAGFDPEWGRIIYPHGSFNKYIIPTELWEKMMLKKIENPGGIKYV